MARMIIITKNTAKRIRCGAAHGIHDDSAAENIIIPPAPAIRQRIRQKVQSISVNLTISRSRSPGRVRPPLRVIVALLSG